MTFIFRFPSDSYYQLRCIPLDERVEALSQLLTHPLTIPLTTPLTTPLGHTIGRDAFLEYDIVEPLSQLFDDDELLVRVNVHSTFLMLSYTINGVDGIVAAKLIKRFVDKLVIEVPKIKVSQCKVGCGLELDD